MLVFMMYHMVLWERVDLLSKLPTCHGFQSKHRCQLLFVFLIHQPLAIAYRVKLKTF